MHLTWLSFQRPTLDPRFLERQRDVYNLIRISVYLFRHRIYILKHSFLTHEQELNQMFSILYNLHCKVQLNWLWWDLNPHGHRPQVFKTWACYLFRHRAIYHGQGFAPCMILPTPVSLATFMGNEYLPSVFTYSTTMVINNYSVFSASLIFTIGVDAPSI